jgi:uncharacterized repeat protein (TIGR01451 family)
VFSGPLDEPVTLPPLADLTMAKSVSNPTPNVGDTITFTVTLADNGPDLATGLIVSDPLPGGLTFVSAAPSQGSYNPATGLWSVVAVAVGAPLTLQVTATVVSPNPVTNTAAINHSDQFDPVPGNNTASATATPQQADIAVPKSVDYASPIFGWPVTHTITVSNRGQDAATDVIVADPLAGGLTLVSVAPTQGSYDGTSGLWSVGTLANGASDVLRITAHIAAGGTIVNTATARADQFDPTLSNNRASASVTVLLAGG